MNNTACRLIRTKVALIRICADTEGIRRMDFIADYKEHNPGAEPPEVSLLLDEAEKQLNEYFDGKRREFELKLAPIGTDFQLLVWKELQNIGYGKTKSYEDIAHAIGRPKACRAVGMANRSNPISIVIPCHRVIGKNGSLVGYASGIEIKKILLKLEGNNL